MENKIDICKELHQNFIDFAYEANSQRAFPDARDGLKPGQRACLWEMYTKGYTSNKPHVKSAKISGGVIANWWPHGDVAIYETFARMSQSWINNIPEVNWHGANGSIVMGGDPASSRYTEARLDKATEDGMFCGIKKKNIPMISNFSEDEEWPEVLPSIFPRLLVNGSQGIGVTISNVWLPMNLIEVAASIKKYALTGEFDISDNFIDFPSGGIIINKNDLHIIHETGKGKVILRAKTEIKNNKILITELPYQVYIEPLIEDIKKLIISGELEDIKEVYNKTDKKKLLVEIECKTNAAVTLSKLFTLTDLQKNFNANQYALVGKTPKLLTLKEYYDIYLKHNQECIRKEYEFDLNKAEVRLNIVDGLLIALEDIDNVIKLIKQSKSSSDAKENLKIKYQLNEEQAKAIVEMRLGKIAHLEKIELEQEKKELVELIKNINEILKNNTKILSLLINRLEDFVKKYGYKRRTSLEQIEIRKEDKEIAAVEPEDCIVIMNQSGSIKRVPTSAFKIQKRNGKGIKTEDDTVLDIISTNTIDTLMLFSNKGKMYRILVDNVPVGTSVSKGVPVNTLITLETNEKIIAITSLYRKSNAKYVIFITKQGLFKKTALKEYIGGKKSTGIAAIKLKECDSIANVTFAEEEEFILITKNGMSIRFETKDISAIGRATSGVKAIKLAECDEVLIGLPIKHLTDTLAVFTENGLGKKTNLDDFPIQGRGGKGLAVSKENHIVGACLISDDDMILLCGKPNSICISAKDIPLLNRTTSGNQMIKGSKLNGVIKV